MKETNDARPGLFWRLPTWLVSAPRSVAKLFQRLRRYSTLCFSDKSTSKEVNSLSLASVPILALKQVFYNLVETPFPASSGAGSTKQWLQKQWMESIYPVCIKFSKWIQSISSGTKTSYHAGTITKQWAPLLCLHTQQYGRKFDPDVRLHGHISSSSKSISSTGKSPIWTLSGRTNTP